jgi:hypothetical protein
MSPGGGWCFSHDNYPVRLPDFALSAVVVSPCETDVDAVVGLWSGFAACVAIGAALAISL